MTCTSAQQRRAVRRHRNTVGVLRGESSSVLTAALESVRHTFGFGVSPLKGRISARDVRVHMAYALAVRGSTLMVHRVEREDDHVPSWSFQIVLRESGLGSQTEIRVVL